jgi:hypothetical protein
MRRYCELRSDQGKKESRFFEKGDAPCPSPRLKMPMARIKKSLFGFGGA